MSDKKEKKRNRVIQKLRHKYRLSIRNDQTYEEVLKFQLSRMNVIILVGGFAIALMLLVTLLIAFTPIREFIPGYPDGKTRKGYITNALKVDSLEKVIQNWQVYYDNISILLNNGEPVVYESKPANGQKYTNIDFSKSVDDSLLRMQIEADNMYNLSTSLEDTDNQQNIFFIPPIKGVVINHYNPLQSHYGIDLVAAQNEVVLAVADGTVMISSWTLETGYTIGIQHKSSYISFYKHNSKLLKQQGERVNAGEPIAIIGNSGELTTGPHLHFELWHNGSPVDPAKFIHF